MTTHELILEVQGGGDRLLGLRGTNHEEHGLAERLSIGYASFQVMTSRGGVVGISRRLTRSPALLLLRLLVVVLPGLAGCSINQYQPGHFQFTTIVEKKGPGPGGWRAACIHATVINKSTMEPYFCQFGVGMPIETKDVAWMSEPLAQRIAADCANKALSDVIAAPASPLPGLVCTQFRNTFDAILDRAVPGSKVAAVCEKKTKPFRVDL